MHILCFPLTDKILRNVFNPLIEWMRLNLQFTLPYFHFPHVEHHINQVLHSLCLPVDGF